MNNNSSSTKTIAREPSGLPRNATIKNSVSFRFLVQAHIVRNQLPPISLIKENQVILLKLEQKLSKIWFNLGQVAPI